jgi:hypothetical protein
MILNLDDFHEQLKKNNKKYINIGIYLYIPNPINKIFDEICTVNRGEKKN